MKFLPLVLDITKLDQQRTTDNKEEF